MARATRKLVRRVRKQIRRQARSPRTRYLLLTAGAAYLAEAVTRRAAIAGWKYAYGEDPPRNPERLDVSWSQAIAWTAITGLGMTMAGLLARRGAAIGWRRLTHRPLPSR